MIQYEAQEAGIAVILTEESYTSGISFIDREKPLKDKSPVPYYNQAQEKNKKAEYPLLLYKI